MKLTKKHIAAMFTGKRGEEILTDIKFGFENAALEHRGRVEERIDIKFEDDAFARSNAHSAKKRNFDVIFYKIDNFTKSDAKELVLTYWFGETDHWQKCNNPDFGFYLTNVMSIDFKAYEFGCMAYETGWLNELFDIQV